MQHILYLYSVRKFVEHKMFAYYYDCKIEWFTVLGIFILG